jgi:hypothetical protein
MPSRDIGSDGMANISVRGVEEKALRKLKETARKRGISLNGLITEMLNAGTGLALPPATPVEHDNLDRLAGTWSAQDAREFQDATATFAQVDEDLWH